MNIYFISRNKRSKKIMKVIAVLTTENNLFGVGLDELENNGTFVFVHFHSQTDTEYL